MRERERPCCVHRVDPSNHPSPGSGRHPSPHAQPPPLSQDAYLPQWCYGLWVVLHGSGLLPSFPKSGIGCLREKRKIPGQV